MSHSSSSILLFTQLVRRLRQTNARYDQIAYQCRRTQRLTYHAKRRAYRVGLHIDTSKARAADHVYAVFPVLDRTAGSPVWVAAELGNETEGEEDDSDSSAEDVCLPNPWPELTSSPEVVVRNRPATLSLSPLGLELINIDDLDTCDLPFRGPVPGAPRWRSRPLPQDECGVEAMTNEPACTYYDPVWRGAIATHVSDSVSMPFDVMRGGLGITVPPCHLKRKLRDVDMDGGAGMSRRCGVGRGVPDVGFSGTWWSGAQRRRLGI